MRISLIQLLLLVCLLSGSMASEGYSQGVLGQKISIKIERRSITSVLREIEKSSQVRFIYNPDLIKANRLISVNYADKTIAEVLNKILNDLSLDYSVSGNQVVIKRVKEKKKTAFDKNAILNSINGNVSDENGEVLIGVTVRVKGSNNGTSTDIDGKYEIEANEGDVLIFSFIGYKTKEVRVGADNTINVQLEVAGSLLEEIVVTGYTSQKKKDIIGAVSVIKATDLNNTPSSNLVTQLQGRASGVMVSSTGDPGGAANIRIRGFASYGNNNPLYIIDGVPTTDATRLNPQDIESIQVLKDASSASIYGARAANGVIIISTKQGQNGRTSVSYNSYIGVNRIPYNRIPEMLNTAETMEYLSQTTALGSTDPVYGSNGSYSIPEYYVVSNAYRGGVDANDPRANPDLYTIADYKNAYQIFKTSSGTNWFKEISQSALQQSHQLTASGGNENSNFSMGLNYYNQEGIFKHTGYDRYTVRLNSSFRATTFLTFGENVQVASDNRKGDNTLIGETTPWAYSFRSAPYIPVYDIKGGYGGTLIGSTSGVGRNPVALLDRRKDWTNKSLRVFGNLFAEIKPMKDLLLKTSLGVDAGNGTVKQAALREYEQAEARTITQLTEGSSSYSNITWSNTIQYQKSFAEKHNLKLLAGTEAIQNTARGISVLISNFDLEQDNFMSLNTGLPKSLGDVSVSNPVISASTLFSYFGRVDYGLQDKYLVNLTFRRDGSSLFGPKVRYANFPSAGVAWRVSDESFMQGLNWLNDLKLRLGYGTMGSISNVPSLNQFSSYGSTAAQNFYDINGVNIGSTQGYGAARQGNLNTKWESTTTANLGIDASLMGGKWSIALDLYSKNTKDLLVPSLRNGLEAIIIKPLINLGTMNNKGIDIQLGNRGAIGNDLKYDLNFSISHYKNKLTKLNDENTASYENAGRLTNISITTKGEAISSFFGYKINGFYESQEDIDDGPKINGADGIIGTWKYVDLNDDGNIDNNDRMVLGTPHPDFQAGFNLGLNYKNFDFNTFLFWNYGNEIFNYNKFYTYMNVIGGGIAKGKLYDAWTTENSQNAKTPKLGVGSENGYTSFVTSSPSSFYVENGTFFRMKTLQLGYTLPVEWTSKLSMSSLRIYLQAQNIFTITKYSGPDPDLGIISGNNTDQNIGVDYSGYPNPRQFLFGLNVNF